jgi:non-lysosomal glucosylceramidase
VSFIGEYPTGFVEYRDAACPVSVSLEAFSPFIPLNTDDSSLPVTVLEFTVRNAGKTEVEVELAGWLENAVRWHSGRTRDGTRLNRLVRSGDFLFLECGAEDPRNAEPDRSDIVFEDFEKETDEGWMVTGTAFGRGPVEMARMPAYQGDVGGRGKRVVNSHASAPGNSLREKDAATVILTSRPFIIDERNYITFLCRGASKTGEGCGGKTGMMRETLRLYLRS